MLFHSLNFLAFFAVFLAVLPFVRGETARIIYVCLASYIFYAWWWPPYLPILIALTIYAHVAARLRSEGPLARSMVIFIGILPLLVFKYSGFLIDNLSVIFPEAADYRPQWKLPLGVSFITFTVIAFVVDTWRKILTPTPYWKTALYIAFFPHLIAGPILRGRKILPRLGGLGFRPARLKPAALLFAAGTLKKVVIADQLAPVVDKLYLNAAHLSSMEAWLAFYAFAIQIYCDFSGYTDMALALAILLGIQFPVNFTSPYCAENIRDFWRRWHITLSIWMRDYLYITFGGSRHGTARMFSAVMLTMLIGGLWHGAAWTFAAWGAYHGLLIGAEHFKLNRHLPVRLRIVITFHLVCIGWVLFRAQNFTTAMNVFKAMAAPWDGVIPAKAGLVLVLIIITLLVHRWDYLARIRLAASRMSGYVVLPLSLMVMIFCAILSLENPAAFIYFDF